MSAACRAWLGAIGLGLTVACSSVLAAPCAGFIDVDDTSPFCASVEWIKNRGVTTGCGTSSFCPSDYVTRLQMAAFMARLGAALVPATADFSPPVVELTAPQVASQFRTSMGVSASDDRELAFLQVSDEPNSSWQPTVFGEGIRTYSQTHTIEFPLEFASSSRFVVVVDTSGNVTKKTMTVAAPNIGAFFGFYEPSTPTEIPVGFDCSQVGLLRDGTSVDALRIAVVPSFEWSTVAGFMLSVTLSEYLPSGDGSIPFTLLYAPTVHPHPLSATNFVLESSQMPVAPTSIMMFEGTLSFSDGSSRTANLSIRMKCSSNSGANWQAGSLLNVTVQEN